jgi:EmrB/QacA subfamily drug resistance transporter
MSIDTNAAPSAGGPAVRKGIILFVLGITQLMIILDATIVNVAIDNIRIDLNVQSTGDLQWIVTGYALAFGGFLLLGGKLADRLGRRRILIGGALLFALASLIGGFSTSLEMLISARVLQGFGGALMAPAALSILTMVFEEGKERDRAFGVWAAISAGGAAMGLLLGGVLTQYASWEWVFFVNVPIALFAVVGAVLYVPESKEETAHTFDIPGAVFITGGLMALVYGLVNGNDVGWGSAQTLLTLGLAALLLAGFVVVMFRSASPMVPRVLLRYHNLVGANIGALLALSGLFAMFFYLVLWMRQINGWSPLDAGFAFLPVTVFIIVGAGFASAMMGKIGPRPFVFFGPLIAAAGLFYMGIGLAPDSSYAGKLLPGLILMATGMGMAFVAFTSAALAGVPKDYSGVASALLNASQQVGGAVGLAVLTAIAIGRTSTLFSGPVPDFIGPEGVPADPVAMGAYITATVDGFGAAVIAGGVLMILSALVMGAMIRVKPGEAVLPTPAG